MTEDNISIIMPSEMETNVIRSQKIHQFYTVWHLGKNVNDRWFLKVVWNSASCVDISWKIFIGSESVRCHLFLHGIHSRMCGILPWTLVIPIYFLEILIFRYTGCSAFLSRFLLYFDFSKSLEISKIFVWKEK